MAWRNISATVVRLVVLCHRSNRAGEAGNQPGVWPERSKPSMVVTHAHSRADQPNA